MAARAELDVIGLILYQQIGFSGRMGLVAGTTVNGNANLGGIPGLHLIDNRVPLDWVACAVLEGKHPYRAEVAFRQPHAIVEYFDGVRIAGLLQPGVTPMALEAEAVDGFCAKQVGIFAAVRLVTSAASLPEGRLMRVFFISLLRLIVMAAKADIDLVRVRKPRRFARVRIVAFNAIFRRAGMLHPRLLDLLRYVGVAGQAELFR
jgi:hypothetical protein